MSGNAECRDVEGGSECQSLPGFEDVESTCFSQLTVISFCL